MRELILKSVDEYPLALDIFEVENPKAVVQICHGMEEHKERYNEFALELNKAGFTVVCPDMRGHGKNAIDLGHFGNKNGNKLLLADVKVVRNYIGETYPNTDVFLFAHSMGTITSRSYLQENSSDYKKVCLSGYPVYTVGAKLGLPIVGLYRVFHNPKYKSSFIEKTSVESFNSKIQNPRTKLDWLSYNTENVDKYAKDPLCGFGFTLCGFRDLYKLMIQMNQVKNFKNLDPNLPFLMVHGEDDPCVGGAKGSENSINTLKTAGFTNIREISYPHMRHEILNEDDKATVMKDIVNFYQE